MLGHLMVGNNVKDTDRHTDTKTELKTILFSFDQNLLGKILITAEDIFCGLYPLSIFT